MRKLLTTFIPILVYCFSYAQVGINTTSPNGATILDIVSNQKGILIPRLTDTDRDTYLADNDALTVPPAGVVNATLLQEPLFLIRQRTTSSIGTVPSGDSFLFPHPLRLVMTVSLK